MKGAFEFEIDVTIRRPVEDVFDRLVDIPAYREWMPGGGLFVDTSIEGELEVGAAYEDRTLLGRVKGEVAQLDRPRAVAFRYVARFLGRRVVEGLPSYRLEPVSTSVTRVRHLFAGRVFGVFRLAGPLIRWLIRGERRRTANALKADLEQSG